MVGIILVNYKREDLTIHFVKEELSKVCIPHITVIVNNGASDESNRILCEQLCAKLVTGEEETDSSQTGIYVLSSSENLGFAKGNNLGAEFCRKKSHPDYLLFTNNDIQLTHQDVVERLVEKLETQPNAAVIGPHVMGLDGKAQGPYFEVPFWDRMVWIYWSSFFYSSSRKESRFRLRYSEEAGEGYHYSVIGCFLIVRASSFFACGMFDPHTFLYAEELILSERMAAIGKGVYYYPEVTVVHAHGATISKFSKNGGHDWQFESVIYYYSKYKHTKWPMIMMARITHCLMSIKNAI